MNVACIISAYKAPGQLLRLISRLRGPDRRLFLHVDLNAPAGVFERIARGVASDGHVALLDRHRCAWGDFGHVEATLKGLDELKRSDWPFDYVVLLTGQDYPIKSWSEIEARLAQRPRASYMNFRPLPVEGLEDGGYSRLGGRRDILGLPVYFGSGYWCLHRDAVEYVIEFLRERPAYVAAFREVFVPDEMFFQTILLNSPLRETIVNDDLRFIKWPGPEILTSDEADEIAAAPDLFARKFDETVDARILDVIDKRIIDDAQRR